MGHDMLLNNQVGRSSPDFRAKSERMLLSRCLSPLPFLGLIPRCPRLLPLPFCPRQTASRYPGKIYNLQPARRWTRQDPEREWRNRTIDFHHPPAIFPRSSDPPHGQPHGHLGSLPASAPRQNRRWPSSAAAVSRQPPSTHPSCPPVPRAIAESLQRQPFSLPLSLPFIVGLVSSTRWSTPPRKLIDIKRR